MNSTYLLIHEYADSGTLRNYLKNNFARLDWNIKLQFAIQIADAVSCMHQKNIIYCDLVGIKLTFGLRLNVNMLIYYTL
jgi:serine/threonine protein kinase